MTDTANQQDQQEKKKRKPLENVTEESLRPSNPKVIEAINDAQAAEEALQKEVKGSNGEIIKRRSVNEGILRDRDVPGFLDFLNKHTNIDFQVSDEDIIDVFLLYEKSPEEAAKDINEKYRKWVAKLKGKAPHFWQNIKDVLKLPKIQINFGKFGTEFIYERIYGALLDKRVAEIQVANLNARDRIKLLRHAFELGDKFEAQATLLSIGHTSDYSDDFMEEYYDHFAKVQDGKIRTSDGDYEKDPDNPDKDRLHSGHLGGVKDMWFEYKLRRETLSRGRRPDVWHSGRRDFMWDGNRIIGVAWKSREWVEKETNADAKLTPGRKGDTAAEVWDYQMLGAGSRHKGEVLLKATEEMLKKRLGQLERELPTRLSNFEQEKTKLKDQIQTFRQLKEDLSLGVSATSIEEKILKLENKIKAKEKELEDDEEHKKLIAAKLRLGVHKNGGFKSLLLDSYSDEAVEVVDPATGKKVIIHEYELAFNRDTYMYATARIDRDAEIVTNAEHIKAAERLAHQLLFSDDLRYEHQWRAQHYSFGVHDDAGNYDEARDGSQTIFRSMHGKKGRGIENFSLGSRKFFTTSEDGTKIVWRGKELKDQRIVTNYTAKDGTPYKVWLDYDLSKGDSYELLNYINLADPDKPALLEENRRQDKSLLQEWQEMKEEAFRSGRFVEGGVEKVAIKLGNLAEALMKEDLSAALNLLSSAPAYGKLDESLVEAKNEIQNYRGAIAKEPGVFEGLLPELERAIADATQKVVNRSPERQAITTLAVVVELDKSMTDSEKQILEEGVDKINQKLNQIGTSFENIKKIKETLEPEVKKVEQQQKSQEPNEWFAERLRQRQKQINDLIDDLMKGDIETVISDDQKRRFNQIVEREAGPEMTALQAFTELNWVKAAVGLADKGFLPQKSREDNQAEAKEKKKQEQAA